MQVGSSSVNVMRLRRFNATTFKADSVALFVGKRRSGKTTAMIDLLTRIGGVFEFGFIFCNNASSLKSYRQIVPPSYAREDMDLELIDKLMRFQSKRIEKGICRPIFIVLDDFAFDRKIMRNSKTIKKLMCNGRHYQIFFMIGVQYCMQLGPEERGQIDYVFMMRDPCTSTIKKLYNNTPHPFDTYHDFKRCVSLVWSRPYNMVVLDNCGTDFMDNAPVFVWKADYISSNEALKARIINRLGWWWSKSSRKTLRLYMDKMLNTKIVSDPSTDPSLKTAAYGTVFILPPPRTTDVKKSTQSLPRRTTQSSNDAIRRRYVTPQPSTVQQTGAERINRVKMVDVARKANRQYTHGADRPRVIVHDLSTLIGRNEALR